MQITIREKNPGPKVSIAVNGEPVIEASTPITPAKPAEEKKPE